MFFMLHSIDGFVTGQLRNRQSSFNLLNKLAVVSGDTGKKTGYAAFGGLEFFTCSATSRSKRDGFFSPSSPNALSPSLSS